MAKDRSRLRWRSTHGWAPRGSSKMAKVLKVQNTDDVGHQLVPVTNLVSLLSSNELLHSCPYFGSDVVYTRRRWWGSNMLHVSVMVGGHETKMLVTSGPYVQRITLPADSPQVPVQR